MYTITLKYLKPNSIIESVFEYIVNVNSYEEAINWVQSEADRRVDIMGGTIISIE